MAKDNIFKLVSIEEIPIDFNGIPGLDTEQIDYVSSIGGANAPEPGATDNSAEIVNGVLITDIANAQFDTSTQKILGEFTFGVSGAIKMIADANNGLWISPTGILGKKAGVTTFAVDTAGNASFRGSVVITGGSGIASLSDAGSLATKSTIGASDCNTTIISDGKIITGLLTASNIRTGTLNASVVSVTNLNADNIVSGSVTGIVVQTSGSANTGVKLSSNLGGLVVYGQTMQVRSSGGGSLIGSIGNAYSGLTITTASGSDIVFDSGGVVISYDTIRPAQTNVVNLGSDSYRWGNLYTSNVDFASGKYINYTSSKITVHSDTQINGTLYCSGAGEFATARIRVGTIDFYVTADPDASGKYYLRSG